MSTTTKITVEQYAEMIDRGEFEPREEHNVELIRGEVVPRFSDDPRTPMNPPHAEAVDLLGEWSFEVVGGGRVRIRIQGSVGIPALESVPQPDLAWLVRKDYAKVHPAPDDVLLLVEVSDSSLGKDRGPKLELYAEAGIRDYWIVNVRDRSIDVYRDPEGRGFRSVTTYRAPEGVRPLAFPDAVLMVSRIFPD